NPAGGDWDTPANWSTGQLPGPGDDVVIDLTGTFTITHGQNVTDSIHSLANSDSGAAITLSGGTLGVATTLGSSGPFTLAGGSLAGATVQSGTTIGAANFLSGAVDGITLAGTLDANVSDGFTLTVTGGLTLDGGSLLMGSSFVNFAGTQ